LCKIPFNTYQADRRANDSLAPPFFNPLEKADTRTATKFIEKVSPTNVKLLSARGFGI
jgi:hypothetical protein